MGTVYLIFALLKKIQGSQPCIVINENTKQCIGAFVKLKSRLFADDKGIFSQIAERYDEKTCSVQSFSDIAQFKRALTRYNIEYKDEDKQKQADLVLSRQAPGCICCYWGETVGLAVLGNAKSGFEVAFVNKHNGRLGEPCVMSAADIVSTYQKSAGYFTCHK